MTRPAAPAPLPACRHARRALLALLAAAVVTGCAPVQVAPPQDLARIRTVQVVAIGHAPVALASPTLERYASPSLAGETLAKGGNPIDRGVYAYSLLFEWPGAFERRAEAQQALDAWEASKDPWDPAAALANAAIEVLRAGGRYSVPAAAGRADLAARPGDLSGAAQREWFRRDTAAADLAAARSAGADAVLEVAVGPIEVGRVDLWTHVGVKLVDAQTGAVLARKWTIDHARSAPPEQLFREQGRGFKAQYEAAVRRVLEGALREVGVR